MDIYTYRDAFDHLIDRFQIQNTRGAVTRNICRAIDESYRKLPHLHIWPIYDRVSLISTQQPQTEGAITYSATTNRVTLAGATWPVDVISWRLYTDRVVFNIARRISDTVIELDSNTRMSADITTGQQYTLFRDRYGLPCGYRKTYRVWDDLQKRELVAGSFEGGEIIKNFMFPSGSDPMSYCVSGSDDYYSKMELVLSPVPYAPRILRMTYQATGRPLKILEYSTGTVAGSGNTLTLTGGELPEFAVGSVIWISGDANKPTGRYGAENVIGVDRDDRYNPPSYERIIIGISGATISLDRELDTSVSGRGYLVTDPIDIHTESMLPLFKRWCEAEYAILINQNNAKDIMAQAQMELRLAKENQVTNDYSPTGYYWSLQEAIRQAPVVVAGS